MFIIIRNTNHPVVQTYMDVIKSACEKTGIRTIDSEHKKKHCKKDVIVSDSVPISMYYILRGYKNVITWIQGVLPEESFIKNKSRLRYAALSVLEYIALKKSKLIFFVSEEMRSHYEKKYHMDLSKKSVTMPCFNEKDVCENSFTEPDKYKSNNFVYVGGMQKWQCFDKIAEIYKQIEDVCNTSKFWVYTAESEEAENILKKTGIKNYEIDFVPLETLAEKLKSMKYGFVIREDTIVNRVATPTKFSNYLANGIIPIYSSCLKSFADFDKDNSLGVIFNGNIDNVIRHMQTELSAEEIYSKCKNAFNIYYNIERYIEKILNNDAFINLHIKEKL